jgi:hypothetical protein
MPLTWPARCSALVALLTAALPGRAHAQGLHLIPNVAEVSDENLGDVAVADVDSPHPVIYYNPRLLNRYGPNLGVFFLAHEYGHLYHHHTRAGIAASTDAQRDSLLQFQELEADCYAAAALGKTRPEAVEAAIRFFTRLGPFRFDAIHPTGAQRASRIVSCMPDPSASGYLKPTGETGIETGPIGGYTEPIRFSVGIAAPAGDDHHREVTLWIDGVLAGRISSLHAPVAIEVAGIGAGFHSYRLSLAGSDPGNLKQLSSGGAREGSGYVALREGDLLEVRWEHGGAPVLEPAGSP